MLTDITQLNTWYDYRRKRFWALALLVLYTFSGFVLAPWLLARNLPELAREFALRDASVAKVTFNPWTLRLQADGLQLIDTDERDLLALDSLVINVSFIDLLQLTLGFDELRLERPQILLARYSFSDTNWGRMLNDIDAAAVQADATEAAAPVAEDDPLPLLITELQISDGVLVLEDTLTEDIFNTRIEPINISVNDLSTLKNVSGRQAITLTTENGVELTWQGSLDLNPLISAGTIQLSGTPLPTIYRYFEKQLGFTLNNCCLEVDLAYTLESVPSGDIEATVSDAEIVLSNFNLDTKGTDAPIFRLPELRISGGKLAWPAQTAHIEEIVLTNPELYLWLNPDGSVNLEQLVELSAEAPAAEMTGATAAPAEPATDDDPEPWSVTLDAFRIAGMRLGIDDRSLATPGRLELQPLNLNITNLSTAPDTRWPVKLDATLASGGNLDFTGSLITAPALLAEGTLAVSKLGLPVLQPWIADAAKLRLERGTLEMRFKVATAPSETLDLTGNLSVTDLGISDALKNEALLGWQRLGLNDLQFALDGNALQINRVELEQPFARVLIAADGSTNFDSLSTDDPASTDADSASDTNTATPLSVKIGRTKVSDGSVDFSDESLLLPFRVLINEFSGSMSAIDSNSTQPSELDFRGRVGEFGQTTLRGDVSVMAPDQQTAVQLDFRNLNMPTLSPYTAEFVGRKIESGKLDLALDYTLLDRRVDGANNMMLKDFALGEKVDNAEAMNLPLDLGIALLTNANGVIDIDLQVEGDMDDPGFSAGGIVLKAFANLITKAVAAPFKLLGGLIPGGADIDLEAIEFEPGRTDLNPPEREKLLQIATALESRPALQLQLNGGYARAADTAALQRLNLDSTLTTLTGEQEPSPKQTRKALEKLMSQQLAGVSLSQLREDYNRPDPDSGKRSFDELAYAAELRRRLEAIQSVDDAYLETLGRQRRDMVLAFLSNQPGADSNRFIAGDVSEAELDERGLVRVPMDLVPTPAP